MGMMGLYAEVGQRARNCLDISSGRIDFEVCDGRLQYEEMVPD